MSIFYKNILWVMIFATLSFFVQMYDEKTIDGVKTRRIQTIWALVGIAPIIYWAAYRPFNIGDTYAYSQAFENMPSTISGFLPYMNTITKDAGFYGMASLIKIFITDNVNLYFLVLAAFQGIVLMHLYKKYSSNYILSIFLFIASTDYISWMYNGVRQFTAVTITLLAFKYILENRKVPAILIIIFASFFHGSALLLIPFVFIAQGDAWNKKTIAFILATLVAIMFIDKFTNILDTLLQETQYENVVSDWNEWGDDGTNILRVLVYAVPTILSLVGLKYVRFENNKLINICVNMSIVSTGLYLVSMVTSGIFIGRLPIYFSLYNYILLPWEIDTIFEKKSAKLIYTMLFIFYMAFYIYSVRGM